MSKITVERRETVHWQGWLTVTQPFLCPTKTKYSEARWSLFCHTGVFLQRKTESTETHGITSSTFSSTVLAVPPSLHSYFLCAYCPFSPCLSLPLTLSFFLSSFRRDISLLMECGGPLIVVCCVCVSSCSFCPLVPLRCYISVHLCNCMFLTCVILLSAVAFVPLVVMVIHSLCHFSFASITNTITTITYILSII